MNRLLAAACALAFTACVQETAQAPAEPPPADGGGGNADVSVQAAGPAASDRAIDWDAARAEAA
jgi:hypothetical protein